ncbi:MAG: hypothetical protein AAF675_04220 [Pseudomonadota bacterium]
MPRLALLIVVMLATGHSAAHASDPAAAGSGVVARAAELDALHQQLASAETPSQARALSARIWTLWLKAPDAAAQALMDQAVDRRRAGDYDAAIAVLDELTAGWPAYAEGWNQRATLFYLKGQFAPSLADVSTVLSLEPRHFGALAGKALILFQMGEEDAANRTLLEALRVHPWLQERRLLDPAYVETPL